MNAAPKKSSLLGFTLKVGLATLLVYIAVHIWMFFQNLHTAMYSYQSGALNVADWVSPSWTGPLILLVIAVAVLGKLISHPITWVVGALALLYYFGGSTI